MPRTDSHTYRAFFPSIDNVLGAREKRFFGDGFRRIKLGLSTIYVAGRPDGTGELAARASIDYPADWSSKGGIDQRPHLSTIDVIRIGAELGDVYLAHTLGLSDRQRRRAVLRRIHVKAGRSPVERDLHDLPVTARAVSTESGGRSTTGFECRVGSLRVHCEIHHQPGRPNWSAGEFASPEAVLGGSRHRLFGEGHKTRRHLVESVEAAPDGHSVRALVRSPSGPSGPSGSSEPPEPPAGRRLEGVLYATASAVDSFVIGLQLGQMLLYRLDGVPRTRSNTLWMRHTRLELDPLRPSPPMIAPAAARLERIRLLESSDGAVWRSADIVSEFEGSNLRCAVAHRLS